MSSEADERLREAVREWLASNPEGACSLVVASAPYPGSVFVLVGTEAQLREVAPRPRVPGHVLREVVNQLRGTAREFHATGQLRERLRGELTPLLEAIK